MKLKPIFSARDISQSHPFGKVCYTDARYAKVANEIFTIIRSSIEDIDINECSCASLKTALYLEDIVSEFGLWESFIKKNLELYGKELPFYERPDKYWINELNRNDIRYLIWSGIMEVREKRTIANPETIAIMSAADSVYDYLEAHFEDMPINDELNDLVFDRSIYEKFFNQRSLLKWIFFDCYLTQGRLTDNYHGATLEYVSEFMRKEDESILNYGAECISCLKYKVGPLALYPKEYLAGLLRVRNLEDCAKKVEKQEFLDLDFYRIKEKDSKYLVLENSEGEVIKVDRTSGDGAPKKSPNKSTYCLGSFVCYDGNWTFNGVTIYGDYSEYFEDIEEFEKTLNGSISQESYDKLIQMASGERLLFAKDIKEAKDIYKKAGLDEFDSYLDLIEMNDDDFKDIAIYIDSPEKGVCTVRKAAKMIKSPNNPYYDASYCRKESLVPLVDPDSVPAEMMHYLKDNGYLCEAKLNSIYGPARGSQLVQENMDFIARFFRQDSY